MGNKSSTQPAQRDRKKDVNTKTTNFRSRFLRDNSAANDLKQTFQEAPIDIQHIVPKSESQVGRLTLGTTIEFLRAARSRGYQVLQLVRKDQSSRRKTFLLMSDESGSTYDQLPVSVRADFHDLVLLQCEHLNSSLDNASKDMLRQNSISEEVLEAALIEHGADQTVYDLLGTLTVYEPKILPQIPIERIYAIIKWRTERMELLKNIIDMPHTENKLKVLTSIIVDETFEKYGLEEEELNWAFKNAPATPEYVEKFKELNARFITATAI